MYPKKHQRRNTKSVKYKEWRDSVFKRDKYQCQGCRKSKGRLHAHHIKPVRRFPKLMLDVNNGATLCKRCHKKIHKELRDFYPIDILHKQQEDGYKLAG